MSKLDAKLNKILALGFLCDDPISTAQYRLALEIENLLSGHNAEVVERTERTCLLTVHLASQDTPEDDVDGAITSAKLAYPEIVALFKSISDRARREQTEAILALIEREKEDLAPEVDCCESSRYSELCSLGTDIRARWRKGNLNETAMQDTLTRAQEENTRLVEQRRALEKQVRDLKETLRWKPITEWLSMYGYESGDRQVIIHGQPSTEWFDHRKGTFVDDRGQALTGISMVREIGPLPESERTKFVGQTIGSSTKEGGNG